VLHKSDSYGSKSANGSWNGMVGLVHRGVADIGIGAFTVTKERSEVVAFIDKIEISKYDKILLYVLCNYVLKFNLFRQQNADLRNFIPAALSLLFISAKYRDSYFRTPGTCTIFCLPLFIREHSESGRILQCSSLFVRKT
jgi:hypothetical protein